jgi:hypothetical protein
MSQYHYGFQIFYAKSYRAILNKDAKYTEEILKPEPPGKINNLLINPVGDYSMTSFQ